ncbi:MAG: hypothetical protein K6U80_07650 [Firmicutes bacterium]|nr:hypothetical protein [Bacillota bacterium]
MKSRLGRTLLFFFCFLFLLGLNYVTLAAGSKPQVLILDIPRFTFDDLRNDTPWLRSFAESGSAGIMTTPLAEPLTLEKVYLAFNSGTQLKTTEEAVQFYNEWEEYQGFHAGSLYQSFTGIHIPSGGVVNLGFPRLLQLNNNQPGVSNIGLMGKIFHRGKLKTAVIGNADAGLPNRDSALLVMDERGVVDYGSVGRETLREDPKFPFGMRTDLEQVYNKWISLRSQADVIVISLGDLERIEQFNVYLDPDIKKEYRKEALRCYDRFIGKILAADLKDTLVVLFSGLPPEPFENTKGARQPWAAQGRLTPVIVRGPGFRRGLLFSGSTRKSGLITCYDIPAAIIRFLRLDKSGYPHRHYLGSRPFKQAAVAGKQREKGLLSWEHTARQADLLARNYYIRWPLLTVYGYLLIGLALGGIIGLIYYWRPQTYRILEYSCLFFLTIPGVFLVEALFNPVAWGEVLLWTVGLAGLLFGVALYFSKQDLFRTLSLISILTVGVIMADGLFNGFLELNSFLGYSAVAGARFYGIGNEYLGFLLGALIVFLSLNLEALGRFRLPVLWGIVGGMALFLALPGFGANIGGGITAMLGLGITAYLWLGRPIKLREVLVLGLGLVFLFVFVGIWELLANSNQITHFGQLLTLIGDNGPEALVDLLSRKFEMNWRLINYTPWTKVLIGVLLLVPFVYKKPPAMVQDLIQKYPDLIHGFFGLTVTALIALLVNDSGIVTVATMFIFGSVMLFLALFQERVHWKKECQP